MQIIVLGMHRSGTSPLTRIINLMGAYVGMEGTLIEPHRDNPKGFWERNDVYTLDKEILKTIGADWYKVAHLDLSKLTEEDRAAFEQKARVIIQNLDAHRPWVLKDPRMCLLLSLWQPLLETPICIHIYRSPLQVAQSLRTRNGFPIHFGAALWEKYNLVALTTSRNLPRLFVSHQRMLAQPLETVRALYEQLLALNVQGLRLPSEREILAFLDPSLYRERGDASLKKEFITCAQEELFQAFEEETSSFFDGVLSLSAGAQAVLENHDIEEEKEQQLRLTANTLRTKETELTALQQKMTAIEKQRTADAQTLQQQLTEAEQKRVALEQSKAAEAKALQQQLTEAEQKRVADMQTFHQQKTEVERALAIAYERFLALAQSRATEGQALQQKLAGVEQALAVAHERLSTVEQKVLEGQALQQKLAGAEQALAAARERLFALEQKVLEGQALQQKLAGAEQALAAARERLFALEQNKTAEGKAFQQKLTKTEQALAAAEGRSIALEQKLLGTERLLTGRTSEVRQYAQDSVQLARWIGLFDRCFVSVINSKRWRLGHALAAYSRKIRFKPPLPMPQEHWESVMKEFTAWKKAGEDRKKTGQIPPKPASGLPAAVLPALVLQAGKGSLTQPVTKTSLAPQRNGEKEMPR